MTEGEGEYSGAKFGGGNKTTDYNTSSIAQDVIEV